MRFSPLLLLAACGPKIDAGEPAAVTRARPVEIIRLEGTDESLFVATIDVGSAADPVGQEGLAWVAARARVAPQIDAVEAAGGHLDAAVDRDHTRITVACPSASAAVCADRFADALVGPTDPQAARSAREAALQELAAPPTALAALDAWRFEGHPYAHSPTGRIGSIVTPEAAAEFAATTWVRITTHIGTQGVPGDVTAALAARLEALQPLPAPDVPLHEPPRLDRTGILAVATDLPTGEVAVGVGCRTPDPADRPAMGLAVAALEVRLDNALLARGFPAGDVGWDERRQCSLWAQVQALPAGKERAAAALLDAEISGWLADGPTAVEIEAAAARAPDSGRFAALTSAMDPPGPAALASDPATMLDVVQRWTLPDDRRVVAILAASSADVTGFVEGPGALRVPSGTTVHVVPASGFFQ